jgi:hypothetical protein
MKPRFTFVLMLLAVAALIAACGVQATPTSPGSGSNQTPTPLPSETPSPTPTPTPIPEGTPMYRPVWLNDLIVNFEGEPLANPPVVIKEYVYKGDTVYYVPARCCDIYSDLYDAEGNLIAHPDGGITGNGDGRASDFLEAAQYVRTVWQDPRATIEYERELAKAPIESADVAVLESFPPQYRLHVVSGLPSGCAAFDHWTVALDEETKTFTVEIYNSVPAASADVACTMIYGLIENSIPLNGVESGHTYTVNVNDHSTTFESQ